jgi:hypothetical protein
VIFCPQVVPENFLALTKTDCQQVFLHRLTLPVPGPRPNFSEAPEGSAARRDPVDEGRQA